MRIRFSTARDVFAAFPTLAEDALAAPSDEDPMAFCDRLFRSETPEDGITFFAYMAPKREAVWWGCRCIRLLDLPVKADGAYKAAERWVREPDEALRRAALAAAEAADGSAAETWTAFGAGWAGGNIAPEGVPAIAAPPHLTAKAVRASVLMALAEGPAIERQDRIEAVYRDATEIANHDIESHVR